MELAELTPEQEAKEIVRRAIGEKSRKWWASLTHEERVAHTDGARAKANAMRPKGSDAAKKHTAKALEALKKKAAERKLAREAAEKKNVKRRAKRAAKKAANPPEALEK